MSDASSSNENSESKVQNDSSAVRIVEVILALALVGALFVAGWRIYRRLPADGPDTSQRGATSQGAQTELTIVFRNNLTAAAPNFPVELYPFDLVALQREFQATPHLAKQFDDFLVRRLQGVTPVRASTDSRGRAVAMLSEGNWWLHARASLDGGETVEWRLPVNVSGSQRTVELSRENAYERTKKF